MVILAVISLLAALFAFVDVWYFIRFIFLGLRIVFITGKMQQIGSKDEIFKDYTLWGVVMPSDLDFMLHMNNSKYLREMDFGRVGLFRERGILGTVRKLGGRIVLAASSVRHRRSLQLFQRFVLKTQILCWDDDAIYLEQRMVSSDGFLCAILFAKMVLRGTTWPAVWGKMVGQEVYSPNTPPEIQSWKESIQRSSEALKKERNSTTDPFVDDHRKKH